MGVLDLIHKQCIPRDEKVLIFTNYLNTVDLLKQQIESKFNSKAHS